MGIYKANTPLKHQSEYAKDYHTSIGTVKKAFALLKNNGLINTVKGHGTYAIAYENSPAVDSGSFRVDSKVELYTSSVNVISHGITHANRQVAKMLDIEPFSSCYGIQLTRLLNSQPIACQNI